MNDKGANIDLLFRNGLKDYEVLPPPGVWDGVHSSLKLKSRPVILLRVAAVITVLLTVSFFTYQWSKEMSDTISTSAMAFNVPTFPPVIVQPVDSQHPSKSTVNNQVNKYSDLSSDVAYPDSTTENDVNDQAPFQVLNVNSLRSRSIADNLSGRGASLNSPAFKQSSSLNFKYSDLQYYPDNIATKPVERWSIAAMASPTYFSRINSGNDQLSSQIISSEEPLFSYSGGVSFSYKISKRFSIQSGLYYSALGQKVDGINSFSGFGQYNSSKGDHSFEVLTGNGTVYTNNPDVYLSSSVPDRIQTAYTKDVFDPKKASLQPVNTSLNQNLSYLEFPVLLRYKIVDKTLGINLIGGLSYNLLVRNEVTTTLNGNNYPVGDTRGLNPLSLSSSLGMGMEYNITSKLSLNLEPTFRYYLNPFTVTTGTYVHPYSFGIFSGVSYKF